MTERKAPTGRTWVPFDDRTAISSKGHHFRREDGRVCVLLKVLPGPTRFEALCGDVEQHVFDGRRVLFPQRIHDAATCLGCVARR